MPLPNPEVYGSPEEYIVTPRLLYRDNYGTSKALEDIYAEFPKSPNFGGAENDSRAELRRALSQGKLTTAAGIDSTISAIGQDENVSAFGNIDVWRVDRDGSNPKPVRDKTVQLSEPVYTFFYTAWYGSATLARLHTLWSRTNADPGKYFKWSPNGEWIYEGNSLQNPNMPIYPISRFGTKAILGAIWVGLTNKNSPGNIEWVRLNQWKTQYQDRYIAGIAIELCTPYNISGSGSDQYLEYTDQGQNMGYGTYQRVSAGVLNEIDGRIDYSMTISNSPSLSQTCVMLLNVFSFSDSYNICPEDTRVYLPCGGLFENSTVNRSWEKLTYGGDRVYIYRYIPYSEHNYEAIMRMTACFGIPFTDKNKVRFQTTWDDEDLYFPVIDNKGITHGEYTHGNANLLNPFNNLKSIYDIVPITPVPASRPKQINVYDINEPQNGFDHNGLAILMPIECISDKEEAGRWDITLVHPIDDYNKWTYIIGQNVIKVNGQLFRIDETEIYQDAEQSYITAHAKHITYDLFDRFVDEVTVENASANEYIYKVIKRSEEILPTHRPEPNEYTFNVSSDITELVTNKVQDQTVIGALFGEDNSLASRYGGQVYRDNFHMSINRTLEGAPQSPAFKLRFGTDLTKLSYKIDFSQWITELICKDNLGNLWGISYTGSTWIIHHQKTRIIHFTYDPETPDPMGCLERDGFAYWQTVSTPIVSIEVSVANLKNDPKYKDFVDLQNLDVGYTGNVYIEQYNIDVNMKIVSIRRDELTGEALQVVLGTSRGSFIRSPVMSQTIVANGTVLGKQELEMQAMQKEIVNLNLKQMRTWGGMKAYKWADVKQYTWGEIINGHKN